MSAGDDVPMTGHAGIQTAVRGTAGVAATTRCMRCRVGLPADAAFCPRCRTSTTAGPVPGPVLEGYTILGVLGHGGASVVYLARQEALDRQVAVKVLRHDVDDERAWRRFRREAQAIAKLSSHPNVVTVYTAGRMASGEHYLVTEYLDRGSLSDVIARQGRLTVEEVASVGIAVARALAAAHELGIVHRDVKPGNVLLNHQGRVKLGDFGIAHLLGGQSVTHTDAMAFTPEHVAPEILRAERDGPWSDVYGLGSTLTTAMTGRPPFARRPGERLEAFLYRKLTAPPEVLPASVPGALAAPISAALDPEPSRRPSLRDFGDQLAAAAETLSGTVEAGPPLRPPLSQPTLRIGGPQAAPASRPDDSRAAPPPFGGRPHSRRLWTGIAAALAAVPVIAVGALIVRDRTDRDATTDRSGRDFVQVTAVPTSNAAAGRTAPPAVLSDAPSASATLAVAIPTTTGDGVAANAIAESQVEAFLQAYFDAVTSGSYEWSWSQLAPEFQRGKARSYDYYVGFWNDNYVEVGDVRLVDATADRAVVNVDLRWNGNDTPVTDQFTLRTGGDGELIIAEQETVS
jgi:tRNA A-37 threonylcarbamoyl transferase component Bud32